MSPVPSLDSNALCGIDQYGRGTFTLEGFTPLCEAFTKMPSLTSVRCAAREWDSAYYPHTNPQSPHLLAFGLD